MEEFKIPKERVRIAIDAPPSEGLEGDIFLSDCAEHHRGQETVSDLLAGPEAFIPVLQDRDGVLILRKDSVRWIRVEDPAKAEWLYLESREGTPKLAVRLEFPEGDSLEGALYAMAPEGERRVVDVVNQTVGFLPLETERGLYLVNLKRVHVVRQMEDSRGGS